MAKECIEQMLWELAAAEICRLHSDNGIFNVELFVQDCKNKFQTQSFSGVGAHHQNALAALLNGLFKSSCTWHRLLRFMFVCIEVRSEYGADNLVL